MAVRILHASDLHLGRAFPHLGDVGVVRERDRFDTFERICNEALDHEVAALLIAGDLFDTFAPPADVVGRVQGYLERVTRAGVQVFIVPGEADSATYERSIWRREAFAGVHVFLTPTFDTRSFEVDDRTVHVHGMAFDPLATVEPLAALRTDAPGVHVALLHATVDGPGATVDANPYFPLDSAALFARGISYLALGHDHERREISGANGAVACYPGSPEGLDAGEVGPRYAALVEFGDGSPAVTFLQVERRQVVNAVVDTTDCAVDEVLERLLELSSEDVLLTALLTGTPREMLDEHALVRTVGDGFFWLETHDETTLSASAFAQSVAGENTIRGHFVATLQRRIRTTRDAGERAALERALKLGLRSLQRSNAA